MLIPDEQIKRIANTHIMKGCDYRTENEMVEAAIRHAIKIEEYLQSEV